MNEEHQQIYDRIDRMEEHNEHTHELLFNKISDVQTHFNKWFFALLGMLITVLLAMVAVNGDTHEAMRETLITNSTRIAVQEQKRVPPPEVVQRFERIEEDAANREKQLDDHIKEPGHRGYVNGE